MEIYYINHSGFLVKTKKCYYIFDYYNGALPELEDKPIFVFSSHAHSDHYNPEIFSLLHEKGVHKITAVLSRDIPERRYPEDIDVIKVYANHKYILSGGELETFLSTDCGVAFLLTTDEGVIYHAGDLNDWIWDGESDAERRTMHGNYTHEIDKLVGRRVDVAFVPLDPRLEGHYTDGMLYFLKKVSAKAVYPMHYWGKADVIARFTDEYPEFKNLIKDTEKVKVL